MVLTITKFPPGMNRRKVIEQIKSKLRITPTRIPGTGKKSILEIKGATLEHARRLGSAGYTIKMKLVP